MFLFLCFAGKGQVGEVWEAETVKEEQMPKTECLVGVQWERIVQSSEAQAPAARSRGLEKLGCSRYWALFPGRGTKWWSVEAYGVIHLVLAGRDYHQK